LTNDPKISIEQCWTRFENWLAENASHLLEILNNGATKTSIDNLEKIIDHELPRDLVEFYKIHDGQKVADEGLIYREQFLSIDKIIHEWECWDELLEQFQDENGTSEPDEGIKSNWWNPLWIPFTHDGCGNHICIDLDPDTKGKFGQVIRMWHDVSHRILYATSFLEWFDNYVKGLETGEIVYAKDRGLVNKSSPFTEP
jgi:cell wall assembly regulator SMI1